VKVEKGLRFRRKGGGLMEVLSQTEGGKWIIARVVAPKSGTWDRVVYTHHSIVSGSYIKAGQAVIE